MQVDSPRHAFCPLHLIKLDKLHLLQIFKSGDAKNYFILGIL
jgi:hypothetical protein